MENCRSDQDCTKSAVIINVSVGDVRKRAL